MTALVDRNLDGARAGSSDTPPESAPRASRVDTWIWSGLVTLLAFVVRLTGIRHPKELYFDEVHYAEHANSMLTHLVEWNEKTGSGAYVVHPPLGKWCIALGEWLFGYNSLGWRISAVVAGTISVFMLTRIALRLFGSLPMACIAGLLLALDGLHLVSSRIAMLDIFLMLFVLGAFGCILIDRERRLAQLQASQRPPGRWHLVPWPRLGAAILIGCALSVKHSAIFFAVLAFLPLAVCWEAIARRATGDRRWLLGTLRREFPLALLTGVVVLLTYLATWSGWLLSDDGWYRQWAAGGGRLTPFWDFVLPDALASLWHYHTEAWAFHEGLSTAHPYQSTPQGWWYLERPVAYFYQSGAGDCGAATCVKHILGIGTPVLWWAFPVAVAVTGWAWVRCGDWRAAALLASAGAGLLPWLAFPERTMFFFYTLPALPFLVLAVTLAIQVLLGADDGSTRRLWASIFVGTYLLVVVAAFVFFYPVFVGDAIPYADWRMRMWFSGWI